MDGIVWIERGGDNSWYLRTKPSNAHVSGRVEVLKHFASLHDDASLAEIDAVVTMWGWHRVGGLYADELGAYQVPVAPSAG